MKQLANTVFWKWWLEPNSDGPGAHQHENNDEVFYGIEGLISILVGDK